MSTKTARALPNGKTARAAALLPAANATLDLSAEHEAARRSAIEAIYTAEDLTTTALVAAIIATVDHGPTSKEEVAACWPTCNNPGVYASNFNRGHKVQLLIGQANAKKVIDDATKAEGGRVWERVLNATSTVIKAAKEQGKEKDGFTKSQATMVMRNAKAAAVQAGQPKERKVVERRGATAMDAATLAAAAAESGRSYADVAAFLSMVAKSADRLALPVGREEEHRQCMAALQATAQLWAKSFGRA